MMCVTIWSCWVRKIGMTWLRKPKPTKGCKANGRTRTSTLRTKISHVISVRTAVILTAVSLRFIFVLTSHLCLGFQRFFFPHLRFVCTSYVPLCVLLLGQSGWMLETLVNMVATRKLRAWVKISAIRPCFCYVSFWTALLEILPFLYAMSDK